MARRRKLRKKRISLLLITLLLIGGLVYYFNYSNKDNNTFKEKIVNKEKKEDPIKVYKASLAATGDGLVHTTVFKAALDEKTNTYDFKHMLTLVKDYIKDYDIKYYNQETVSDDDKTYFPGGGLVFNTPSQFGLDMIDAGFNLVSLSSNHSMDMKAESAKKHATWWEEKASEHNLLVTGMASSTEKRNDFVIKEVNGISYAMLSYTYGLNGNTVPSDYSYVVNVFDEEQAKKDIEAIRDKVDVLIVSMHWGNEYKLDATEKQKKQAKFLADNGVDIVLGTHSHCIEPFEWIDDTLVFYSFGNFISNQMGAFTEYSDWWIRRVGAIGMIATLDITKTVDTINNTTDIKIDNVGAELLYTYRYKDKDKGKFDYLVIPFSNEKITVINKNYIESMFGDKTYLDTYKYFSDVLTKYDTNINIKEAYVES